MSRIPSTWEPEKRAQWMQARLVHGGYAGGKEQPEHYVWRTMISRCYRTNDKSYPHYGGRGIGVCPEWVASYSAFIRDMGKRPTPDHSIERRNVNADYTPENCEWATRSTQQQNKVGTRYYFNGYGAYTLTEVASLVGISKELAHLRFKSWGTFDKAQTWHELQKAL